jgi:hypothetical protein
MKIMIPLPIMKVSDMQTHEEVLAEFMQDPEFKKAYDELESEFRTVGDSIKSGIEERKIMTRRNAAA